jgi:hypothetical protein
MLMTSDSSNLPAVSIPVHHARLILLWPLAFQLNDLPNDSREIAEAMKIAANRIEQLLPLWVRQYDPAEHIRPTGATGTLNRSTWENDVYAEGVYFHPFIQNVLFAKQETNSNPPFWLFQRHDIQTVDVGLIANNNKCQHRFDVERINLYLFRTGTAILVTEIATPNGHRLTLADVEDLHDYFRRAYHPFVQTEMSDSTSLFLRKPSPLVVKSVCWREVNEHPVGAGPFELEEILKKTDDIETYCNPPDRASTHRAPPIFPHWRELLADALPLASDASHSPDQLGYWRHVVDERMPTLLTVSVTAPEPLDLTHYYKQIRQGDYVRLCFADNANRDPGKAENQDYPSDPTTYADFDIANAYDRYRSCGTRFLFSGYALVAVGAGEKFDNYIRSHMRRHYFQMMLLVQFEAATLLAFSTQISGAIAQFETDNSDRRIAHFREHMHAIQEEFLQFVHRFRFTGVSNQIQGREMFDRLRDRLGLEKLFDEVRADIESANTYLFARAQADASEEAGAAADAATRLGRIAAVGVIGGFATSFLGMNFLAQPDLFGWLPGSLTCLGKLTLKGHLFLTLLVAGVILHGGVLLFGWLLKPTVNAVSRAACVRKPSAERQLVEWIAKAGWLLLILSLFVLLFAAVPDQNCLAIPILE